MIEDKLTHDERLRLECIAQAVAFHTARMNHPSTELIVKMASDLEIYVKGSNDS